MMLLTATGTQQIFAYQAVETKNAVYYAGKTVTLSAYDAGLTTTTNLIMVLSYSTSVDNSVTGSWTDITVASGNANLTLSSTVTRWSAQYAVPADAKSLRVLFVNNAANITVGEGIYLGDVQLEVGSVATAFSRAGGTIQGELAACNRYYYRADIANNEAIGNCNFYTGTSATVTMTLPVQMRTDPSFNKGAVNILQMYANNTNDTSTAISLDTVSFRTVSLLMFLVGGTQGQAGQVYINLNANNWLEFSAEL
jgi:hypothetical protein